MWPWDRSISKFDLGRSISDFEGKNQNFAALHFCVCPQRTFLFIFIALYNFIEVSARSKVAMTILEFYKILKFLRSQLGCSAMLQLSHVTCSDQSEAQYTKPAWRKGGNLDSKLKKPSMDEHVILIFCWKLQNIIYKYDVKRRNISSSWFADRREKIAESAPFVSKSDPPGCSISTDIILRDESKGNTHRYF